MVPELNPTISHQELLEKLMAFANSLKEEVKDSLAQESERRRIQNQEVRDMISKTLDRIGEVAVKAQDVQTELSSVKRDVEKLNVHVDAMLDGWDSAFLAAKNIHKITGER